LINLAAVAVHRAIYIIQIVPAQLMWLAIMIPVALFVPFLHSSIILNVWHVRMSPTAYNVLIMVPAALSAQKVTSQMESAALPVKLAAQVVKMPIIATYQFQATS